MDTILVAIDFSEVTSKMIQWTLDLAKKYGSKVFVLHVAAPEPDFVSYSVGPQHERKWRAEHLREEHRELEGIQKQFQDAQVECTALMIQGPTTEKILQESERLEAKMIVMGSHGHGAMYHLLVGSVLENVLRKATVPVLIVPSRKAE
ncbi:MAG: universal stress protein [Planctomycetota bacterium]